MNTITIHRPTEREAFAIVLDFAAAADRLAVMASDWKQGQFRRTDITTAAASIAGMNALLGELRATNPSEE